MKKILAALAFMPFSALALTDSISAETAEFCHRTSNNIEVAISALLKSQNKAAQVIQELSEVEQDFVKDDINYRLEKEVNKKIAGIHDNLYLLWRNISNMSTMIESERRTYRDSCLNVTVSTWLYSEVCKEHSPWCETFNK